MRTSISIKWFCTLILFIPSIVFAGPPYTTDDPEPVEYQHWEINLAWQPAHDKDGWSGTVQFELNYGALPELQLHIILPLAFNSPVQGPTTFGYSDTEIGVKYRFLDETSSLPQIGVFPLAELPTGNPDSGFGNGNLQIFLPLWLQKSMGKWTTYGGGGYWINSGIRHKNYSLAGLLVQNQILKNLSLGVEIFHKTSATITESPENRVNLGVILDISELHHILFSAGRELSNSSLYQAYLAYQLTFGPKEK